MIDTHCHLDYLKNYQDRDRRSELIHDCAHHGIEKIITISVSESNLTKVQEIAHCYPNVYCSLGIHPHEASSYNEEIHQKLIELASDDKVVAVGETGLDYHYNFSQPSVQKACFARQLEIAQRLSKPVVIHTREAEQDTMEVLKYYHQDLARKGVLHSFTSSMKLAHFALDIGFFIGFNGIITFKNAKELQEVVKEVPLSSIVLETDAPYLAPTPHRGKENSPLYLKYIAEKIAELKKIDLSTVIKTTTKNANRLFQLVE